MRGLSFFVESVPLISESGGNNYLEKNNLPGGTLVVHAFKRKSTGTPKNWTHQVGAVFSV